MATSSTARVSAVSVDSTQSVEIAPVSGDREGLMIWNDSTADLYLLFGTGTASSTDYSFKMEPGDFYEMGNSVIYQGAIQGRWSAVDASGKARVTELI